MLRAALLTLSALMLVATPRSASARASYMNLRAAVAAADAVAIVKVESSQKLDARAEKPKKGHWNYGQKNTFRFVEFIKRAPFVEPNTELPQVLWAEKDFICASESVSPGLYLAILESVEPGEWILMNHYKGELRIENDAVAWPYGKRSDEKRSLNSAKESVARAKASSGEITFTAEIDGSFHGLYNRWISSQTHQVLVFHLEGRAPSPFPAERLFARAVVPREIADQSAYESWVQSDGRLAVQAEWVDGSLLIRKARRIGGSRR